MEVLNGTITMMTIMLIVILHIDDQNDLTAMIKTMRMMTALLLTVTIMMMMSLILMEMTLMPYDCPHMMKILMIRIMMVAVMRRMSRKK